MINTTIHSTANLLERHRRAIARLAAEVAPEWPRAVVMIGDVDLDDLVHQAMRLAVWWVGDREAAQLRHSALFWTHLDDNIPAVILCRSYGDGRALARDASATMAAGETRPHPLPAQDRSPTQPVQTFPLLPPPPSRAAFTSCPTARSRTGAPQSRVIN